MSKFKVGEKVRVRKDLVVGEGSESAVVTKEMIKYCGKSTTINRIDEDGDYQLKNCNGYFFTDEMLEPVKSKQVKIAEAKTVVGITGSLNMICKGSKSDVKRNFGKSYVWYRNGNVVTCVISSKNIKGVGIAKCNPVDEFNYYKGCELAEARANVNFYENMAKNCLRG